MPVGSNCKGNSKKSALILKSALKLNNHKAKAKANSYSNFNFTGTTGTRKSLLCLVVKARESGDIMSESNDHSRSAASDSESTSEEQKVASSASEESNHYETALQRQREAPVPARHSPSLQSLAAASQHQQQGLFNPLAALHARSMNRNMNMNNQALAQVQAQVQAQAQALAAGRQQGLLSWAAMAGLGQTQTQSQSHAGTGVSPEQQIRNMLASGRFPGPPNLQQGTTAATSASASANPSDILRLGNLEREAALLAARLRHAQNPSIAGFSSAGFAASLTGLAAAAAPANQQFLASSAASASAREAAIPAAAPSFPASLQQAGLPSLGSPIPSSQQQSQMMQLDSTRRLMMGSGGGGGATASTREAGGGAEQHLLAAAANWRQQHVPGSQESNSTRELIAAPAPPGRDGSNPRARKKSSPPSSSPQPPSKRPRAASSAASALTEAREHVRRGPPQEATLAVAGALPAALPPVEEAAPTPHYSQRAFVSLAIDEDQNWLSEFQCFIRQEILEVFRATNEDVRVRNNSKHLATQQVGIRCRYCAHLPPSSRASRSSAFPSSVPQIYQSFTMMLRDHWPACESIPSPQKEQFREYKSKNNQGASDSKNYWMHAARRIGMVNTSQGIQIDDGSRTAAARIPPFGHNSDTVASLGLERDDADIPLVLPEDKELLKGHPLGDYWYFLLGHVQRVRLSSAERVGNRKSLRLGLPGFGCRYCAKPGWLGLSRIFPARRRTLPTKIPDLHDHLGRCALCPPEVKERLVEFEEQQDQDDQDQEQQEEGKSSSEGGVPAAVAPASAASASLPSGATPSFAAGKEREFFTRIWARLGHGDRPEPA
ncbi:expressed unknown protein [Seminavis robusta]|uniref:Uncharacterized protein n=1 Tax=Seminavis robusta TaxID=568900 RepID=A0A9N8D8H2_9STRA|nr:expressed unknown protein [Seminavis robusta]|eukprot:Sro2_g001300.1 n/a (834) ;mRNA; r:99254-102046